MNLEEFNIIIFVTGIIIGGIVTLVIKNISAKNSDKKANTHSNIITMKTLQEELDSKQAVIDSFFTQSSEKLLAVEKNLASLRDSLAENAAQISHVVIEPSDKSRTLQTPMDFEEHSPPKDYASKQDNDTGMLSDSFGLHDNERDLEPKRTI
ncbi:DUF1043 family protein [Marinomonas hwangdonensis]|uniref:DUF1043 family protein n=1 Tax=Marinomonas hwangdonensis TaxID=1053647 RepID=A0A3M8Q0T7_9GAMM|nr:DUF1043 family protein [Marinomonas hwangdonensis]RNF49703.1 DUF1043 family protein [Marinomonas hwangdonensis]